MNRTKKNIKRIMQKLHAVRCKNTRLGNKCIIGNCWIVPTEDIVVTATHQRLGNPFPLTCNGLVVPTYRAKQFIKVYNSLQNTIINWRAKLLDEEITQELDISSISYNTISLKIPVPAPEPERFVVYENAYTFRDEVVAGKIEKNKIREAQLEEANAIECDDNADFEEAMICEAIASDDNSDFAEAMECEAVACDDDLEIEDAEAMECEAVASDDNADFEEAMECEAIACDDDFNGI